MRESRRSDRSTPMLVVLVVLSFLLMTFDIRSSGGGVAGTLREGTQTLFAPVQKVATSLIAPVADFVDGLANLAGLREENERLRAQISELEARLDEISTLEAEVETLRRISGLTLPDQTIGTIPARVVSRGDNFDASFTIDKGTGDGVVVGNPVVDENGALVGEVTLASESSATVEPIIRPTGGVTISSRSGESGVLKGRGAGTSMELEIPDATEPVFADDLVVTAGSTKFPPLLPVAKVESSASPEARRILTGAVPLADFNRLSVVVVLRWTFEQGPAEEEPTTTTTTTTQQTTTAGSGT